MNHQDLDRILSEQPEIEPSPGFAMSVMKAVRTEAATPPPIPFPGWCVAPFRSLGWGILVAFMVIAALVKTSGRPSTPTFSLRLDWTELITKFLTFARALGSMETASIVIALLIVAASLSISWRFMSRRI